MWRRVILLDDLSLQLISRLRGHLIDVARDV